MKVLIHLACVWHWCGISFDWVYSLNHYTSPSFVAQEFPRYPRWLPKAWSMRAALMLLGRIHIHIHSIWRLSNTLHVSDIDVGSILIGSTASITAFHHHLLPRNYPDFYVTSQSLDSRSCWNVVRMDPFVHPLHMKVVKHLACVWHWYEICFDWVYSLNHCTSPSFVAQELPRFLGDFPKLCQQRLLECC
jgi:hypothetical protein